VKPFLAVVLALLLTPAFGQGRTEKAIFAAGCFWCTEEAFEKVPGVLSAVSGYVGGTVKNPTYEQVSSGRTGHAEAVEVTFDPGQVSYEELVERFWAAHDPTQKNRQGPDLGSQYRSAIFFTSPEQQAAAQRSRDEEQDKLQRDGGRGLFHHRRRIVTEITPAVTFWPAEDYHQQYLEKRGQASCNVALRH
jgi:peptide-methionine (S)-S-oxide reductase